MDEACIGKDMAPRLLPAGSIALHRSHNLKLSNDPAFVEKVRDIKGMGFVEGLTRDDVRSGTATFSPRSIWQNGQVISRLHLHFTPT